MRLYMVYNGYVGAGALKCIVIADSRQRAIELAREQYKIKCAREPFYSDLIAECLCWDASKEFASDVDDE